MIDVSTIYELIVNYPLITIPLLIIPLPILDAIATYIASRMINVPMSVLFRLYCLSKCVILVPYYLTGEVNRSLVSSSKMNLLKTIAHSSIVPGFVEELFFRYVPSMVSISLNTYVPLVFTNLAWIVAHVGSYKVAVMSGVDIDDLLTIVKSFIPFAVLSYGYSAAVFSLITLAYLHFNYVLHAYLVPAVIHCMYNMLAIIGSWSHSVEVSRSLELTSEEEVYWSVE